MKGKEAKRDGKHRNSCFMFCMPLEPPRGPTFRGQFSEPLN